MDRISPMDPCVRIVIKGAAQTAKTEGIHCGLGYLADHYPGPMLVVQSTVDLGRDWSKDRFQGLVDGSPRLQRLFGHSGDWREKDTDKTIRYKRFPGGSLFVAGANAPSGLRSKPVRFLFLDEVDSYPKSAGKEGDPVTLAERRTSNFASKKIVLVSTPTIKGESRIAEAYEQSDQRKYFVPCPSCGQHQVLHWESVKWPEGRPLDAYYVCDKNGCIIEEGQKLGMLKAGEWRATNPGGGDGQTHGYHISALYSPFKTWGTCATEFVAAKPPGRPANLEMLKTFINTVLAEEWDDTGGREVHAHELMAEREKWWLGDELVVPKKATVLSCGVDTQDDRLEGYVWAWGPGKEMWLIHRWNIPGDPQVGQVIWDALAVMLSKTYKHESGVYLPISIACIDMGGHATDQVLLFCDKNKAKRWFAVKGFKNAGKPIWTGRALAGTKKNKRKTCYPVGTHTAKSQIVSILVSEDRKSRIHFPKMDWCDNQMFEQLCCHKLKHKFAAGYRVSFWWKPEQSPDEGMDCTVYALAGIECLLQQGTKLDKVPDGVKPIVGKDGTVRTEAQSRDMAPVRSFIPQFGDDWLRG